MDYGSDEIVQRFRSTGKAPRTQYLPEEAIMRTPAQGLTLSHSQSLEAVINN